MRVRLLTIGAVAALYAAADAPSAVAQAVTRGTGPTGPELSRGVSWFPHGPNTRPVGLRRLTTAEVALARRRAEAVFAAFRASPHFSTPRDRVHLVTSTAAIEGPAQGTRAPAPVLQQDITAYWSMPSSVRRLPDGILSPKLGGAHDLVYFELNRVPRADQFADPWTYGDFSRGVVDGAHGGYFAMPATYGTLGGGTIFADVVMFTRDGRPALAPAPLGALLELEIARLSAIVAMNERISADRLAEADAGMTPAAVAERRAARERVWRRETPDAAVLARRLDAAHVSDSVAAIATRREAMLPETPDPRHPQWGPKLALTSSQNLLASLGATGRSQPACARKDPAFGSTATVRFVAVGSATDCVPMMQVRGDLLDAARPATEVQLLLVQFRGSRCGAAVGGAAPVPGGGRCGYGVPLLRELDWGALRRAMGWTDAGGT
jgi:hypothetical protein